MSLTIDRCHAKHRAPRQSRKMNLKNQLVQLPPKPDGVSGVFQEAHYTLKAARQFPFVVATLYELLTTDSKAMSSMSELDVEIQMDCMVVEIDRPWLHAELFSDAELDSGK
jgi:hypothetical protein